MKKNYHLQPSIYENMPLANICYDLNGIEIQGDKLLLQNMNSNARRKIKKSLS